MLLDRETTARHHLSVIAQDGGGLSCRMDIIVELTDINDNAPQFTQSYFTASVPENSETKVLVMRVSAVDADIGAGRKVQYSLRDVDEQVFTIDPPSGIITLLKPLDRELQSTYNLTVVATDQVHCTL